MSPEARDERGATPGQRGGEGAAVLSPQTLDTFSRVRANCAGASYMNLDKHAAQITEVVARARLKHAGRRSDDDAV